VAGEQIGWNVRHRLHQHLKNREKKLKDKVLTTAGEMVDVPNRGRIVNGTFVGPVQINDGDVECLILEVWRNRCAVTKEQLGVGVELMRWDLTKPSTC